MPTYISLLNYTHEGVKNLKGLPDRLEAIKQVFRNAGGELKAYHLTLGQYDAVVISEMPDDESVAKLVLTAGIGGNFGSQTLRAFSDEETKRIVGSLP